MEQIKRFSLYFIVILIIISLYYLNIFLPLEKKTYDLLQLGKYLLAPTGVNDVITVIIDEDSLDYSGGWPISRDYYARVIETLEEQKARAIGLDILLSSPSNTETDKRFAELLSRYDNIVLPVAVKLSLERGLHRDYLNVAAVEKPLQLFLDNSKTGHVNFIPDRDGIIRKLPLKFLDYPAFSLELARLYLNNNLNMKQGKNILINFNGPGRTVPRISLEDLLKGNFKEGFFQNRLVLIGTDISTLGDRYMTPFSRYGYLSGVELNAQAAHNLINRVYFKQLSFSFNLLLLIFILILCTVLFSRFSPKRSGVLLLAVISIYLVSNLYLFYRYKVYFQLITPLISILILYGISLLQWYLFSEREKRYLIDQLSPYLAADLLNELLKKPELLKLGGQRVRVSIFFADIRGFTKYAEDRSPEEVVKELNKTFTRVNEVIFKYKGTLDKYLGDGVMAFFGAPLPMEEHGYKAFKAAVEIQKMTLEGQIPFSLGIGINSGPVLVGNIGSRERMDYTVIGDIANKAARFVELAEPGEITLGENTFLSLPESVRGLKWIREERLLKGSVNSTVIYCLKEGGISE